MLDLILFQFKKSRIISKKPKPLTLYKSLKLAWPAVEKVEYIFSIIFPANCNIKYILSITINPLFHGNITNYFCTVLLLSKLFLIVPVKYINEKKINFSSIYVL